MHGCEPRASTTGRRQPSIVFGERSLCTSQARKIRDQIVEVGTGEPIAEAWHQALACLFFNELQFGLAKRKELVGAVAQLNREVVFVDSHAAHFPSLTRHHDHGQELAESPGWNRQRSTGQRSAWIDDALTQ